MRISTSTIFETGGARISELQVGLSKTQQQIASGRKILSPADDPIGAARALVVSQSDGLNTQFAVNRQNAKSTMSASEGVLGQVTATLHNVKTLIINAGNGALSNSDRASIATELQGNLDQLLGLANTTDGTGAYLFSGYSTATAPFTKTAAGAAYNGDIGQRMLQVDTNRQLELSESGVNVFGNIRTSAGQFNVVANPSNIGQVAASATINAATAASLTGNNYDVSFDATAANFKVVNKTTGATVVPNTAYASPQTVTFDGITVTLTNSPAAPAPGDHFSIQPGNQNIFETLTDLINALNTPATLVPAKKDLTAALNQANGNVDLSLGNVLTARTKIGTGLKEIDALDEVGDALGVVYKQSLSEIQDLDYAKAITDLNQHQTILQAAQQSFVKTASMSLFSYIN